jgi:hypothetical protein
MGARARLAQDALRQESQTRNRAADRLQIRARRRVLGLVQAVGEDRGVGLGHHERLDELVGGNGGEPLDAGVLQLELLDAGREPFDLTLEHDQPTCPSVDLRPRKMDAFGSPNLRRRGCPVSWRHASVQPPS